MGFMFAGAPVGMKVYQRKDGSKGAMVQFLDVGEDGAAQFYEFAVPPQMSVDQFQIGQPCSFPVIVGGKDAYYKIAGAVKVK